MPKSAGAYNGKVLNARLQDCKNARFGLSNSLYGESAKWKVLIVLMY